jgi:hypothetical protein
MRAATDRLGGHRRIASRSSSADLRRLDRAPDEISQNGRRPGPYDAGRVDRVVPEPVSIEPYSLNCTAGAEYLRRSSCLSCPDRLWLLPVAHAA